VEETVAPPSPSEAYPQWPEALLLGLTSWRFHCFPTVQPWGPSLHLTHGPLGDIQNLNYNNGFASDDLSQGADSQGLPEFPSLQSTKMCSLCQSHAVFCPEWGKGPSPDVLALAHVASLLTKCCFRPSPPLSKVSVALFRCRWVLLLLCPHPEPCNIQIMKHWFSACCRQTLF
jgi:hypothetical protein